MFPEDYAMSILVFKFLLLKTKNEFCKKIIPIFFMSKPFPPLLGRNLLDVILFEHTLSTLLDVLLSLWQRATLTAALVIHRTYLSNDSFLSCSILIAVFL